MQYATKQLLKSNTTASLIRRLQRCTPLHRTLISATVCNYNSTRHNTKSSNIHCAQYRQFSSGASQSIGVGPSGGKLVEFNLADIGEGIAECELLKWFVTVGTRIEQFDKICEVQSDKANVEITSRYDGVIRELKYEVGQLAKVGSALCVIETDATEINNAQPSSTLAVEDTISTEPQQSQPTQSSSSSNNEPRTVLTSPAVRHLARQHNIDLSQIRGTGPQGRLLKEDVLNHIAGTPTDTRSQSAIHYPPTQISNTTTPASSRPATISEPQPQSKQPQVITNTNTGYLQQDEIHTVSGLQRIMVNTMTAANAVPTFGFSDEIIVDQLVQLRESVKPTAEKRGIKLSYLPFIIKATSLALKSYPQINAHVNSDCTQVTRRAAHNIGLAMDTPRGLLVPNIKNVQNLSILEIAAELNRLAAAGTAGKLGTADLTGGTFTLSNIGSLGGTYMKPILVVPEVVIGAMGTFQTLPRYDKNMVLQPTKIMYISWTGDHRVLDGATVARFSTLFKSYLETPQQMLLDTR